MARISPLDAAVPSAPFLDPGTGDISPAWRAFLTALWRRTGGAVGISSDTATLEAELQAETEARIATDNALGTDITTETTARQAADQQLVDALQVETYARIAGDGRNVAAGSPAGGDLAGTYPNPTFAPGVVCGYWRGCDLSTLPTSDPGHGQPWLDGGYYIVVGSVGLAHILLEDDSGYRWTLEGGGDWLWG